MKLLTTMVLGASLAALQSAALHAQDGTLLARGKYLMEGPVACGNCHMTRGAQGQPLPEKGLSGGMLFDEPPFKAYAANITPDKKTGIGNWSEAQLAKAIREGIRPDGSVIGPPMPIGFYRSISDQDLKAIVTYLKAQPAVANPVPKSQYHMPLPPNYGPPVGKIATPPSSNKVKYGEYLAQISHCMECHTPRDAKGMLQLDQLGAGGQNFKGPWGESVSANLTPVAEGLKNWSDAEIAAAIRTGKDNQGYPLKPPMGFAFYEHISESDMGALIAYLRSLKPQKSPH
ncbi:c-type cytochrome [Chitinibacter bivalviorum]|uniref:C-type cytochrome n=1 Tax=Chitinibacter bivalviorum TaxID=2739434 RepID=A0A7H9BJZ1_9NEIS|nr:c-type cytochrome [Chitinibacter bivalviorum]QLG88980.1 c-type cytochrome [Chitinibacter bivalviorum]